MIFFLWNSESIEETMMMGSNKYCVNKFKFWIVIKHDKCLRQE